MLKTVVQDGLLIGNLDADLFGAGDETRTRDIQLGRLALYQLSYSRIPFMVPGVGGPDDDEIAFVLERQVTTEEPP